MARAGMCALPMKLATCARVLKIDEQKDKEGARLLRMFSMPRKPTKKDLRERIRREDEPEEFEKLLQYCLQDVRTEQGVDKKLPIRALPPFEQRMWTVDSIINARGILIDKPLAHGASALASIAVNAAGKELFKLTKGAVDKPTKTAKIKAWAKTMGVTLGSMDKEHMPAILAMDLPPIVRKAVEIRAEASMSSTAKYSTMLRVMCKDKRVRGSHSYHEATTGRWSGKFVQFQNLPRPAANVSCYLPHIRVASIAEMEVIGDRPMTVLRDCIRHAVIAPEGKTLCVSDLSAIEARVLGWLANEPFYLEAYKSGLDLYKVMASKIFRVPYEEVTEWQRFIGKESVLGLGYSMWKDTFASNIAKKVKEKVERHITDLATDTYRSECENIVLFWKQIEKVSLACVSTRKKLKLGLLGFEMVDNYFTIILPSGRRLWYPEACIKMKVTKWGNKPELRFKVNLADGPMWEWFQTYTYGGRLTENVVQAIARDVIACGLIAAETAGLTPVMHVHDEIICETLPGKSDLLRKLMSETPAWAKGLPLDAKVFESTFYRK